MLTSLERVIGLIKEHKLLTYLLPEAIEAAIRANTRCPIGLWNANRTRLIACWGGGLVLRQPSSWPHVYILLRVSSLPRTRNNLSV